MTPSPRRVVAEIRGDFLEGASKDTLTDSGFGRLRDLVVAARLPDPIFGILDTWISAGQRLFRAILGADQVIATKEPQNP